MKDRLVAGALAGTSGAVLQDLYGYLAQLSGLTHWGYIDFARAVVLCNARNGPLETILAFIAHLVWDALLGILFSYIIYTVSHRYYYLKALIYGSALWFMIHAVGTLFRLPVFFHIPARLALLTLIGAIIYSLGTAFVLEKISHRSLPDRD